MVLESLVLCWHGCGVALVYTHHACKGLLRELHAYMTFNISFVIYMKSVSPDFAFVSRPTRHMSFAAVPEVAVGGKMNLAHSQNSSKRFLKGFQMASGSACGPEPQTPMRPRGSIAIFQTSGTVWVWFWYGVGMVLV